MRLFRFFCEFAIHVTVLGLLSISAPASEQWAAADSALGDPERGQRLYQSRCSVCHSLDSNRVGPKHRGVFGRQAGGVEDYAYSRALKESSVVWSEETLESWLENPRSFIAGQRMNVRVRKPQDRSDIISYLKQESEG